MADIGLYIACILAVQALVVKYDDSITMDWLEFQHGELSHLLAAEVVSGDDATKENVIERVTSGSASLVHFLVHGTPGGRADRHWRKKRRVGREREENTKGCVSLFCSLFHFFLGGGGGILSQIPLLLSLFLFFFRQRALRSLQVYATPETMSRLGDIDEPDLS